MLQVIEDLKSQLADAVLERTKLADLSGKLTANFNCNENRKFFHVLLIGMQIQLAQKEAHIAELDATSSGEAIRLTASFEAARGELARIEQEHV